MDMGGITGKENAAGTIAVCKPRIHVEGGCPGNRTDHKVLAAAPLFQQCRQSLRRKVDVALQGYRPLKLEHVGARQRTQ